MTLARELWAAGYQHLSVFAKPAQTPEYMATLRNSLGPDALRAESFYVNPKTGRTFACASLFAEANAKVWPVESAYQPALV
jgi:hypothetical protein